MNILTKKTILILHCIVILLPFLNTTALAHTHGIQKTIALFHLGNTISTATIRQNETENLFLTTLSTATKNHSHSITLGSGTSFPQKSLSDIITLHASTPKEAFNQIPSHKLSTLSLGQSAWQPPYQRKQPEEVFLAHGRVFSHGNLAEMKTKLFIKKTPSFNLEKKSPIRTDISLTLGQDIPINTNNKALLTAEIVARDITNKTKNQSFVIAEYENAFIVSLLLSNNSWIRKQIAVNIIQPEHQAAALQTSLIYYLYGPRLFKTADFDHYAMYADNSDPVLTD